MMDLRDKMEAFMRGEINDIIYQLEDISSKAKSGDYTPEELAGFLDEVIRGL